MLAALAVLSSGLLAPPEPTPGRPVTLPTEYFEDRFLATPTTPSGRRLKFFTDTGGGMLLTQEAATELGMDIKGQGEEKWVTFPPFQDSRYIPAAFNPNLYIIPRAELVGTMGEGIDGMLGQQWFAGRVWTFDYPRKKLLWRAPGDLPKHKLEHETKVYFQTNLKGERQANFARIEGTIDGETLSFLFDTGATNVLTQEAVKEVDDGPAENRATSFLTKSFYERWRAKHPDWKVVTAKTKTGQAMIRVPEITLGGYTVGPVWFTVQNDHAFHEYMAQWMDKPTEGALGGSALKYLRITVDWPNAIAVFERPKS